MKNVNEYMRRSIDRVTGIGLVIPRTFLKVDERKYEIPCRVKGMNDDRSILYVHNSSDGSGRVVQFCHNGRRAGGGRSATLSYSGAL